MTVIRKAAPEDAPALLVLIAAHAAYEKSTATVTESHLRSVVADCAAPVTIFVVEADNRLIAYAALTYDYAIWSGERYAHLDCLFVEAAARGGGIGKHLLNHVRAHARAKACRRLEWQTPQWNENAIRFYEREGATFEPKARFKLPLV